MNKSFFDLWEAPSAAYRSRLFWSWNSLLEESELRRQISRYMKRRFDLEYAPIGQVLVTVGGSEGLDACFRCMLEPGDKDSADTEGQTRRNKFSLQGQTNQKDQKSSK